MSAPEGTGPAPPTREPADQTFRRLYESKLADVTRCGMPEAERIPFAIDFAVSEIQRCATGPLPIGGTGKLEDDLYRALGVDRVTGVRFPPQETRA